MICKLTIVLIVVNIYIGMIVYPFKTAYVNKNGEINQDSKEYNYVHFMNDYYDRLLYITMKIGNPSQEIKVLLTYQDCGFKIGKAYKCLKDEAYLSYYNKNNSSDFNYTDYYTNHLGEFGSKGCSAKDTIYSYTDMNLKNYKNYKNIGFYLGSDTNDLLCGVIGFKMDKYNYYCPKINNIIRSFKSNDIINNYNWILKYNTFNEGLLIFGSNMSDVISNYDEKKLFGIKSRFIAGEYRWSFYIDEILCGYNNKNISGSQTLMEIENDFSFLLGNNDYKAYIYESFFKEYIDKNICKENDWEYNAYNKYSIIECDKEYFGNEQINKFPSISFLSKELGTTLKFENNELFTETKYKYFFNIIFSYYGSKKWIFGKLFLKKYPVMINIDENTIKIYDNYIEEENDNNNNNDNFSGSSGIKTFLLVFGIIILFVIIGVLGYFLGKNVNKTRKKKANELTDDEYDYISKEDIIKNNFSL